MTKQQEKILEKEFNIFLGRKLRDHRERAGWTVNELGERIGLPYKQVHKYECADSRMPASTLFKLTQLFATTPKAFLEGFTPKVEKQNDNQ